MTREFKDRLMEYYFGPYKFGSAKLTTIDPSNIDISEELEMIKKYTEEDVRNTMTLYNEMYKRSAVKNIKIEKVIFNPPATIVFWSDGEKTVVKAHDEAFDPEKGLAMAFCKHCMGDKFKATFKKYNEQWDEQYGKHSIFDEISSYPNNMAIATLKQMVNSAFGVPDKTFLEFPDKTPAEQKVLRAWCSHRAIFTYKALYNYLKMHPYTAENKKYYKNIGLTRYKTLCEAAGYQNETI